MSDDTIQREAVPRRIEHDFVRLAALIHQRRDFDDGLAKA